MYRKYATCTHEFKTVVWISKWECIELHTKICILPWTNKNQLFQAISNNTQINSTKKKYIQHTKKNYTHIVHSLYNRHTYVTTSQPNGNDRAFHSFFFVLFLLCLAPTHPFFFARSVRIFLYNVEWHKNSPGTSICWYRYCSLPFYLIVFFFCSNSSSYSHSSIVDSVRWILWNANLQQTKR